LNVGDRILIENIEGIAAAGRYQVGYVVGGLGISLVVAYNSAWAPIIYAARDPGRWRLLADTAAAVMRLAPLVVGMLAIGGPIALVVLAPPAYDPRELTAVNAIVSLSILPYVIYTANVLILFARERTGALLWAAPVAALLNFVLNLLLIPSFGLAGAAAATLLGYTGLATIVKVVGRRMAAVSWESRAAVKACLLGGALCGAAILAPTSTGWLAVRGLVTGLLLVAVVHEARRLIAKERLAARSPVAASAGVGGSPGDSG
jgi:O-antigen/teichoic acid export membrane protein